MRVRPNDLSLFAKVEDLCGEAAHSIQTMLRQRADA